MTYQISASQRGNGELHQGPTGMIDVPGRIAVGRVLGEIEHQQGIKGDMIYVLEAAIDL